MHPPYVAVVGPADPEAPGVVSCDDVAQAVAPLVQRLAR
jgi:hypothetical protein